jgi:hypothetical protein
MSAWSSLPSWSALNTRDRRALLLGALVLLPALLWLAVVRPYNGKLTEVREQIASERSLLVREQQLLARAQSLPDDIAEAEAAAERAELRLVRAPNTPLAEAELSSYLESVASVSRVLLHAMRGVELRRNETFPTPVRPIRLAVTGESDLIGVVNFLNALEGSPLLIRIRELLIKPVYEDGSNGRGGGTPTGIMEFSLTIEAFAPAEANATETSRPQTTRPEPETAQ